jgi:predicted RND superfamily exporter protein
MKAGSVLVGWAMRRARWVAAGTAALSLVLALLALLPTLWPATFSALRPLRVDTDPENMLPADEAVRVFHDRMKRELALHDLLVVGVVADGHPDGAFNPATLARVHELAAFARGLRWREADGREVGVIGVDLLAPSNVDNIEQAGPGLVRFEWLAPTPPADRAAALAVRDKARRLPFLNGTLVSMDGRSLCLYLPLTSKDVSYRVYTALRERIASFEGEERYYLTGLPVAEDAFGVEMFVQMAISAPLAMAVIFALMWLFFRRLGLVLAPMAVALASVLCTMGLLVVSGQTVHIMSSMIPIFVMPIAVLDSVHILSQFFDRYPSVKDRRAAMGAVMGELFTPMLYTSLTTAAGFASLALVPIPPVQVFGLFVAVGVLLAWLATIVFVPAYVALLPERVFADFGEQPEGSLHHAASRLLHGLGRATHRLAWPILALAAAATLLAGVGIARIQVNDNPIHWFEEDHPIRAAERVLNQRFGGTYSAFLSLAPRGDEAPEAVAQRITARLEALATDWPQAIPVARTLASETRFAAQRAASAQALLERLTAFAEGRAESATGDALAAWEEAALVLDEVRQGRQVFKRPELLAYLEGLQAHLAEQPVVGKTHSLADVVKTVYRELLGGDDADFRVPDGRRAVAQTLVTYQNSHRPQDLWHLVTPDYRRASVWVQLTSGANRDMAAVAAAAQRYLADHPPPLALEARWFGLTYINVVWQERMVTGMLEAFAGSFLVVFLMMVLLLRSGLWAALSMLPLTLTLALIYGVIGLAGKDYDMPVAVLSALSLGLAVDFAIHFLVQARARVAQHGTWAAAAGPVFAEPARAIARNVVVISLGFLPLLLAPLVPYQTVGLLIAAILFASGWTTLVILPALIRVLEPWLFPVDASCSATCNYLTFALSFLALAGLAAVNLNQFLDVPWRALAWPLAGSLLVVAALWRPLATVRQCSGGDGEP